MSSGFEVDLIVVDAGNERLRIFMMPHTLPFGVPVRVIERWTGSGRMDVVQENTVSPNEEFTREQLESRLQTMRENGITLERRSL